MPTRPWVRAQQYARASVRVLVELAIASFALLLIGWAIQANQRWFDRHFLPAFFVSRRLYVAIEWTSRAAAAALGVLLLTALRPRAGRFASRNPLLVVNSVASIALAVAASELIVTQLHLHASAQEPEGHEPRRRTDAQLGWTFVPSRAVRHPESGRLVEYAFDAHGYRVARLDAPVDPDRPSILFTGESMMVGEGLTWEESVPARVGAMLGVQSANLAVSAYASDQAYLRLRAELPHFREPRAVVTLFAPALFDRNMDDDRPHLGPGLVWQPPAKRWRLLEILRLLVRYRKSATVDTGVALTRQILQSTAMLARSRGAMALVVVPQFLPETDEERALSHRLFDDAEYPLVRVALDGHWRIPADGHPDARAAAAIAQAIVERLRGERVARRG